MGKNSKKRRDNKMKKAHKNVVKSLNARAAINKEMSLKEKSRELDKLFDPTALTTPKNIDGNILEFCHQISNIEPVFLDIKPEDWCRQSCCDLNVQEYIKANGGSILYGYKIWYNEPNYIEGERHAVWQSNDGILKDITFNIDGEKNILFIADELEKQSSLEANQHRIRWGRTEKVKHLIAFQEEIENMISIHVMSDAEAWDTAVTYIDWCNGKRMPNQFLKMGN